LPHLPTQLAVLLCAAVRLTAASIDPACDAANRQAIVLLAANRASEAQEKLFQFVAQLGSSSDDNLCRGIALNNLTAAYQSLGKFDLAEQAVSQSVNLLENEFGPNSVTLRRPLQHLAGIAIGKGQFSKASHLLSRAESLPGADLLDQALSQGLRAKLLAESGHAEEAEAVYRESIAGFEQAGHGATPRIAPELCNLAVLYLARGRVPDAIALLQRVLKIAEVTPLDADTYVKTLADLAVVESRHNDPKQAELYFERALAGIDSLPAGLRPNVGRHIYLNYATFLRSTGRKREAKTINEEALSRFGPEPVAAAVDVAALQTERR